MRIEDLRFFIRVAEARSINQVAQKHYISQQGLSRIIANLESQLDVKLFHRGRTMNLTPAGEALLADAKIIEETYLRIQENAKHHSMRWSSARGNIYTIYATPVICSTMLPGILSDLTKRYPGMFFNVVEKLGLLITDGDEAADPPDPCSLAILSIADFLEAESQAMQNGTLNFEHMFSDTLCCSVSADSPLSSQSEVSVEELRQLPFVLHNTEALMGKHLLGDAYQVSTIAHTTNHALCREMISKGMAVGLTSDMIQYVYRDDGLLAIPLDKKVEIKYGCIRWPNDDPFVGEIASVIREHFRRIPTTR